MTLDLAVSRAALLASTVAAVLHSDAPWFIEVGGLRLPAQKAVSDTSVSLTAEVPNVCFIEPPTTVCLYEGDVLRRVTPLTYPGAGGFEVCITFDVVPVGAAVA